MQKTFSPFSSLLLEEGGPWRDGNMKGNVFFILFLILKKRALVYAAEIITHSGYASDQVWNKTELDCNNKKIFNFSYSSSSFPLGASQIQVTDGPEVPPDRVATARDLQILAVKLRQGSDVGSTGRYDDNRYVRVFLCLIQCNVCVCVGAYDLKNHSNSILQLKSYLRLL